MHIFSADMNSNLLMSKITSPKIRLASTHLYSTRRDRALKQGSLAIGGGGLELFGRNLGCHLLGSLRFEGKEFEFSFMKFWKAPRSHFEMLETKDELVWRVKQGNVRAIMITEIHCKKDEMEFTSSSDDDKKQILSWSSVKGCGSVKIYRRAGIYCKLIDDISVTNCDCEFKVFEEDMP